MGAVMRSSLLLLTAVVALAACASGSEKQWTKPGGDYTTAEFQRDLCVGKIVQDAELERLPLRHGQGIECRVELRR